jgi:hypothetical protein
MSCTLPRTPTHLDYDRLPYARVFCAYCPDGDLIPDDCPANCRPPFASPNCQALLTCPCMQEPTEHRRAAFDAWLAHKEDTNRTR